MCYFRQFEAVKVAHKVKRAIYSDPGWESVEYVWPKLGRSRSNETSGSNGCKRWDGLNLFHLIPKDSNGYIGIIEQDFLNECSLELIVIGGSIGTIEVYPTEYITVSFEIKHVNWNPPD